MNTRRTQPPPVIIGVYLHVVGTSKWQVQKTVCTFCCKMPSTVLKRRGIRGGLAYALREKARRLSNDDHDEQLSLIERALPLFVENDDSLGYATALADHALALAVLDRVDESSTSIEKALAVAESIAEPLDRVDALINVATGLEKFGNYDQVNQILKDSVEWATKENIPEITQRSLFHLARVHYSQGELVDAMIYSRRYMEVALLHGSTYAVAQGHDALGILYARIGDYDKSLHEFNKELQVYEDASYSTGIMHTVMHIGGVLGIAERFEEALPCVRRALDLAIKQEDTFSIERSRVNLSFVLARLGQIEEARQTLAELGTIGYSQQTSLHVDYYSYSALVELTGGNHDKALEYITKALEVSEKTGDRSDIIFVFEVRRDIALAQNDLPNYVKYNDLYTKVKEEKAGAEANRRVALMEREQELQRIEQERAREREVLYSTLPRDIADRVVRGEDVSGDHYDDAAVMFLDVVGFTRLLGMLPPGHVVHLLDALFEKCDDVVERHRVTKIKTIGDSYMAVAFPATESRRRKADLPVQHLLLLHHLRIWR